MTLYEWLEPKVVRFFKILLAIGSVFALFFLFRWWGLRGLSGLLAGMFIMAYLILSLNPAVMFFVKLFRGNIDVKNFYGSKETKKEVIIDVPANKEHSIDQ